MVFKGSNRRQHRRVKASFVVSYRPLDEAEASDLTQSRNFSQGGMLLTTNKEFPEGMLLKMFIRVPLIKDKIYVVGRVMESKQVVKNFIYETRIAFQNLEDEIGRVLADTVEGFTRGG